MLFRSNGLAALVREASAAGRLTFMVDAKNAVQDAEFVFMCLPTPQGSDGSADMSYMEQAAREISPWLAPEAVVVNKSTVPVGSARQVEHWLDRSDVYVVSNPEFLREGTALNDFLNPDRVVVGGDDQEAAARVADLYESVHAPILITDAHSAETIKYVANAFLATKLSFANAVAAVCEAVGADVSDVMLGLGYDKRVGHEFLKPGPGWGGSCFPKDTRALLRIANDAGYDFALLEGVLKVNEEQFDRVVERVERAAGGSLEGIRVGALGLSFKAGTGDTRDSPSLAITRRLVDRGATIRAYDPVVVATFDHLESASDPYEACTGADVVLVLTEWDEFKWLDPDRLAAVVRNRHVIDARNILERNDFIHRGFTYEGIGLI